MTELELEYGTARIADRQMQCQMCGDKLDDHIGAQHHIANHRWQDKLSELKVQDGRFDSSSKRMKCRVCGRTATNTDMNLHIQQAHYDSESFSVLAFGTSEFAWLFRET